MPLIKKPVAKPPVWSFVTLASSPIEESLWMHTERVASFFLSFMQCKCSNDESRYLVRDSTL